MRLCVIFMVVLMGSLTAAAAQDAVVHNARVHDNGTYTRVVFEMTEPREPSIFTLANALPLGMGRMISSSCSWQEEVTP